MHNPSNVWIADFGSQYTQLISRRCRELGFNNTIYSLSSIKDEIASGKKPKALILSGGPDSVLQNKENFSYLFDTQVPTLGICFGFQVMASHFGGEVTKGLQGEYGLAQIESHSADIIPGFEMERTDVWMSHGDCVSRLPENWEMVFKSDNHLMAGARHKNGLYWGLQFHPEVEHTPQGKFLIKYFLETSACLTPDWNPEDWVEQKITELKKYRDEHVLCAFSGGVDSLVAASLLAKAECRSLHCFFVDNGLVRNQDIKHLQELKKHLSLSIEFIDAKEKFYTALKGITDPEEKRKIIGKMFIEVFDERVSEFEKTQGKKFKYLLQGTLFPDVIESLSPHQEGGKSQTIKSHHNVGGLPEKMNLQLIEPLNELFKDEVRKVGEVLGLKKTWLYRHPFPGPGLAVRILGEVNPKSIKRCQHSDDILYEELVNSQLYNKTWQAFTVDLGVESVGVKGDARAYENVMAIRMVDSVDGMTCQFSRMPYSFLEKVATRMANEIPDVTRIVYDITSKPPATIEWE